MINKNQRKLRKKKEKCFKETKKIIKEVFFFDVKIIKEVKR
jgi:hypothetical protein